MIAATHYTAVVFGLVSGMIVFLLARHELGRVIWVDYTMVSLLMLLKVDELLFQTLNLWTSISLIMPHSPKSVRCLDFVVLFQGGHIMIISLIILLLGVVDLWHLVRPKLVIDVCWLLNLAHVLDGQRISTVMARHYIRVHC